jgi:hypothetical protein
VWRRLARVILDEIGMTEHVEPLDKEIGDHKTFGEERAELFTGRARYLEAIGDYLRRGETPRLRSPDPLELAAE